MSENQHLSNFVGEAGRDHKTILSPVVAHLGISRARFNVDVAPKSC